MKLPYFAVTGLILAMSASAAVAQTFSINDALREAAKSNPGVGEASANRRATESELRQTQSTLLPQVRIDASVGPEQFQQSGTVDPVTALPVPTAGAGA
jgi:outer membrane protein, adhesin transport system